MEQILNQFIFYPDPEMIANPHMLDLPFDDVWLTTCDSVQIHGWFLPREDALATMLFLHGNAGNISHRLDNLRVLVEAGFQVLIVDYRGFGHSEGTPNEQGTYLDAEAAWRWLVAETAGPHVVFGRSLGGAVAVQLASTDGVNACAVIVENTFTRGRDMAAALMPIPGIGVMLPDFYPNADRIGAIDAPLLVVHSEQDEMIPFAHGEALHAAASEPKAFFAVPNAHHNDAYVVGGATYVEQLRAFVQRYCPMRQPPPT